MGRKRRRASSPRSFYYDSPAPAEIADERARNDQHDTDISSVETTNTNQANTLDGHDTRLDAHGSRLGALESAVNAIQGVNEFQGTRLDTLRADVDNLQIFRNRTQGFASFDHDHDTIYFRRSYIDDNFATRPHGAGQHS